MKSNLLALAARSGPVALIHCHTDHCDALLIIPGQQAIEHISLPDFTEAKARSAHSELESALRHKGLRERGAKMKEWPEFSQDIGNVLASLWHHVVEPVLNFLGYTTQKGIGAFLRSKCEKNAMSNKGTNRLNILPRAFNKVFPRGKSSSLSGESDRSSASLPHITWCPTGALSFLPLHTAGDYDQPGSRVFDYVIASYTPTLTALLVSVPTSLSRTSRVLAIGPTHTTGHSSLPGTATELECIEAHMRSRAEYSQLTGGQATMEAVLDAMEDHDWVHLACRAHQNVSDPTKSGFYLHDGTLDLASINRRPFKNKGLAFLSACQIATGDEKLPDEAIHLASGMLMAGYPSVIATMWSVMDSGAPLVADKVYAELMKEGKVGNGEAGKALHHAVAALRNKVGEKSFEWWISYVHMGS